MEQLNISITYTDEQLKAMQYVALNPQEWIQNAWNERARRAIDEIVEQFSDKRLDKISPEEKLNIVREAKIKTAKERQLEFEKSLIKSA